MRAAFLMVAVLCTIGSSQSHANPVPADELSIANGAEYYAVHCAGCHGVQRDPIDDQWYEPDAYSEDYDFSGLVDEVEAARRKRDTLSNDETPEWAKLKDPGNQANDAAVRAEIMADLVSAIDAEYGYQGSPLGDDPLLGDATTGDIYGEDYDLAEDLGFNDVGDDGVIRAPGAGNLADPVSYFYGTDEQDLYRAISVGTGQSMPGFLETLGSEEAVWDLVNYIRSLWGQEWLD